MGNRAEGRKKKKSIKANVTSKFSGKRLLSRMGKQVKAGTMGPSTDFITRSAVLKKLQITLKDFRRLCILKGIYPRVPAKPLKGADKVYYDIKDISYLSHEPLLNKFREFKAFMKKIRRAAGRKQFDEARRKDELKPTFKIDHLVKERYPRFIDALRDMDDALSMIHLFAYMPSEGRITVEHTAICKTLARHWQYYIARSRNLQKVFVSVKGIYYQTIIMGETITWLVPHKFTQTIPREIDIRVMMTFLEFYEVFMKFTLFKLYGMINLQYPPEINKQLDDAGCYLYAVRAKSIEGVDDVADDATMTIHASTKTNTHDSDSNNIEKSNSKLNKVQLESINSKIKEIEKEFDEDNEGDETTRASLSAPLASAFAGLNEDDGDDEDDQRLFEQASDDKRPKLFSSLKVFVNREVPLEWLQFCLVSFGGSVGWEGPASPFTAEDPAITHQIVDRPMQVTTAGTREYVQPQWVFDSINAQFLLPINKYRPGCVLPPHLSPFVDDNKEGYVPKYKEDLIKLAAGGSIKSAAEVSRNNTSDDEGESSDDEEEEDQEEKKAASNKKKQAAAGKAQKVVEQLSDDEQENKDSEEVSRKGPKGVVYEPKQAKMTEDEEAAALSKIMMGKKSKRLYGRMQHGINKKKEAVQKLVEKRKALETTVVVEKPSKKNKTGKK